MTRKTLNDISGNRYGDLVAVRPTERKNPKGYRLWLYQCDCGNTTELTAKQVSNGVTCCGCTKPRPVRKEVFALSNHWLSRPLVGTTQRGET